jgi:hypothetical protein
LVDKKSHYLGIFKFYIKLIRRRQPRLARMLELSKPMSCKDVCETIHDIKVKKANYIENVFFENKLDAIVMPGFAVPSPKLDQIEVIILYEFRDYNTV